MSEIKKKRIFFEEFNKKIKLKIMKFQKKKKKKQNNNKLENFPYFLRNSIVEFIFNGLIYRKGII